MGIGGGGCHVLSVATVEVHSDPFAAGARLVLAHIAVVADPAGDPVIEDHTVADLERGVGLGADSRYLPSNVAAKRSRQSAVVGRAGAQVQVQMVQSTGTHPKHDLARGYFRLGTVAVDQFVGAAVLGDINGLHKAASGYTGLIVESRHAVPNQWES